MLSLQLGSEVSRPGSNQCFCQPKFSFGRPAQRACRSRLLHPDTSEVPYETIVRADRRRVGRGRHICLATGDPGVTRIDTIGIHAIGIGAIESARQSSLLRRTWLAPTVGRAWQCGFCRRDSRQLDEGSRPDAGPLARIKPILEARQGRIRNLREIAPAILTREEFVVRAHQISAETQEQVTALLTGRQRELVQQLRTPART